MGSRGVVRAPRWGTTGQPTRRSAREAGREARGQAGREGAAARGREGAAGKKGAKARQARGRRRSAKDGRVAVDDRAYRGCRSCGRFPRTTSWWVDTTNGADVIGETSSRGPHRRFTKKAIYLVEAALYQVRRSTSGRKGRRQIDCDTTRGDTYTKVTVLDTSAKRGARISRRGAGHRASWLQRSVLHQQNAVRG